MPKVIKILSYIFIFLLISACVACASSKKSQYATKRYKNSHVNASQLGRNKYYFSSGYQKKLSKNFKR